MTEPASRPGPPPEPIDPQEKTPLPVGRLLLGVVVAAAGIGGGLLLWNTDLLVVYAFLLFAFALIAVVDVVIVVRRTARGEPTLIQDDDPALLDTPRDERPAG